MALDPAHALSAPAQVFEAHWRHAVVLVVPRLHVSAHELTTHASAVAKHPAQLDSPSALATHAPAPDASPALAKL